MGTSMSMTAPSTMILGGGGCVGIATLESLLLRESKQFNVICGVRDVEKFKKTMIDVPVVETDMSDPEQITTALRGVDRVFIVVPSTKNRTQLTMNALNAAKEANVKFILLMSVTIATSDTIFGRQFLPLKDKVQSMGIPFTIIRLPMFFENLFMHGRSVAENDCIYDPRDPRKQFSGVALADVGKCAAEILLHPSRHINKTYKLVSERYSMVGLTEIMSKLLGKKIKVKETTWKQFCQVNLEHDIPEWQIEGTIEWLKHDPNVWIAGEDETSIWAITGDYPTTLRQFVSQNAAKFGWRMPRIAGRDMDIQDDPIMQNRLVYAS